MKKEANTQETWRWIPTWRAFLEAHFMSFLLPVFFQFWGENFMVSLEKKKTWVLPYIFFPVYPTKYTLKKFISLFFPKFFIHPISPPNKHTFFLFFFFFFFFFQVLSFWSAMFMGTKTWENQSFNFTYCSTKY